MIFYTSEKYKDIIDALEDERYTTEFEYDANGNPLSAVYNVEQTSGTTGFTSSVYTYVYTDLYFFD